MRLLTLILCMVNCACLQAQFTYFNQITGEQGDLESEVTANVEVVDDGYVIFGGGVNEEGPFYFVRKYDFEGAIIDENVIIFPDEYFYTGIINSFQYNPYTEQFVVLQGSSTDDEILVGRMLTLNTDLDLIQDLYINTYSPETYFFGFLIEPDGYVIYGEQGPMMNSRGTFIMKLDFEGNVVWTEILQEEVYQHIYRNWSIEKIDGGYLIGGGARINSEAFGLLTKVNSVGQTISEISVVDSDELLSGFFSLEKLINGEMLVVQPIGYDLNNSGNPNAFWQKIRLSKFDAETEEFYWEQDYYDDYELFLGGVSDLAATADGGAIMVGGRYGSFFDHYGFIMKIDSEGNEEWYQEYTYETCDDCTNILYDIELTADGGYIAAGSFTNYAVDPRNATWLVKVDACGDLEWQGCEPLSVPERRGQSFTVYPNPSHGQFTVETATQSRAKSWRVFDLSGRQVAQGSEARVQQFSVDLNLPSGFYTLQVEMANGKMEAYKIQVVK